MHMLWSKSLLMRPEEGDISAHLLLINHQTRTGFCDVFPLDYVSEFQKKKKSLTFLLLL